MSSKKGNSNPKKRKKTVIIEKQVPNFDSIYDAILDSYAFIFLAYRSLEEGETDEEYGCAVAVLQHGVKLLQHVSDKFEQANMRLDRFCRQKQLPQENEP